MANPFDTALLEILEGKAPEPELSEPVDGDQLLHDVSTFIARYLHCSEHQRTMLAVWVLHTYCYRAAQVTPYLSIRSAQKQSGKTRCLLLLHLLCDFPALTAGFTASSLSGLMKGAAGTLLLDECQASLGTRNRSKAPVLRAILANGAHCVSDHASAIHPGPRKRFCPKAFAGRGPLPEDLADLSIPIILEPFEAEKACVTQNCVAQRGEPQKNATGPQPPSAAHVADPPENLRETEGISDRVVQPPSAVGRQIERLHIADATESVKPLRKRLRSWRAQNLDYLQQGPAYGELDFPPNLSLRQQDMVEPLLQIADISGGEWPHRIREAFVALFAEQAEFELLVNIQLLADLRDCFAYHAYPDRLTTNDMLDWVHSLPPRPWDMDGNFSAYTLARLLLPFGIRPRGLRQDKSKAQENARFARGYQLKDFQEAWQKHLGSDLSQSQIANKACPRGELASRRDAGCDGVTLAGELSGSVQENLAGRPAMAGDGVSLVGEVSGSAQERAAQCGEPQAQNNTGPQPPGSPSHADSAFACDGVELPGSPSHADSAFACDGVEPTSAMSALQGSEQKNAAPTEEKVEGTSLSSAEGPGAPRVPSSDHPIHRSTDHLIPSLSSKPGVRRAVKAGKKQRKEKAKPKPQLTLEEMKQEKAELQREMIALLKQEKARLLRELAASSSEISDQDAASSEGSIY